MTAIDVHHTAIIRERSYQALRFFNVVDRGMALGASYVTAYDEAKSGWSVTMEWQPF